MYVGWYYEDAATYSVRISLLDAAGNVERMLVDVEGTMAYNCVLAKQTAEAGQYMIEIIACDEAGEEMTGAVEYITID